MKINFNIFFSFLVLICTSTVFVTKASAAYGEPVLIIKAKKYQKVWTRSELLKSKYLKKLFIVHDPAYDKPMNYEAVPAWTLFKDIPTDADSSLLFHCIDGFSSNIAFAKVNNQDQTKAVAYIAISSVADPVKKFPDFNKNKKASAGPFYLVWENPDLSQITHEEWPYQLISFEVKQAFEKEYPLTVPDTKLSQDHPVQLGYQQFKKNCFVCHSLNNEGPDDKLGPDLNAPHSPTEYMYEDYFKTLIRNPQSLRSWKKSSMSAFSKEALSDRDIQNIWAYLKHMSLSRK